jgi:hypothetical protein
MEFEGGGLPHRGREASDGGVQHRSLHCLLIAEATDQPALAHSKGRGESANRGYGLAGTYEPVADAAQRFLTAAARQKVPALALQPGQTITLAA